MKSKTIKHYLFYAAAVGFGLFLLFFVITCSWIGYEVKSQCHKAQREHDTDCVASLIAVLKDENKDFRSRNDAIWALGQMGDSRALPVLESYYTGTIPSREPLDESISQYELKKAIKLTSGALNVSAFIWRNMLSLK